MRNIDTITKAWLNLALADENHKEIAAENGADLLGQIAQHLNPILGIDLLNADLTKIKEAANRTTTEMKNNKLKSAQECGWVCVAVTLNNVADPNGVRRFLLPANLENIDKVVGCWIQDNAEGPYSIELLRPSEVESLKNEVDLARAKIRELEARVFLKYDKEVRLTTDMLCIPEEKAKLIKDCNGNEIGLPANSYGYRVVPFMQLECVFGRDSCNLVYNLAAHTAKAMIWNLEYSSDEALQILKKAPAFITFEVESVSAQIHIDPDESCLDISFKEESFKPRSSKTPQP